MDSVVSFKMIGTLVKIVVSNQIYGYANAPGVEPMVQSPYFKEGDYVLIIEEVESVKCDREWKALTRFGIVWISQTLLK